MTSALSLPKATVARVLGRHGKSRLPPLQPPPKVVHYEYKRPGGLIQLDVKKLDRIASLGHRIAGDKRDTNFQCFGRFVGVVREIAAEGRLRDGDVRTAAQVLWAACHGMVALMITKPSTDWAAPDAFMKVMLDGLLFGLVSD